MMLHYRGVRYERGVGRPWGGVMWRYRGVRGRSLRPEVGERQQS